MARSTSSMSGDEIDTAADIIEQNGGAGEYEIGSDGGMVERWQFPRFPGADTLGTCSTPGKVHSAGNHQRTDSCKKFKVDLNNLYLSRTGIGPNDTDVETLVAWLEAPRNLVGFILLLSEPGTGKLLPMETPIPTPTGWTTMGALKKGDRVLGRDGKPTTVTFTSEIEETPDLYDVTFSDGSVVTACFDHQWVVSSRNDRLKGTEQVLTTGAMLDQVRLNDGRINYSVRVAGPLDLPRAVLPVDPYVMGAWLGDGSTNRDTASITSMDESIIKAVLDAGYPISSTHQQPNNRAATYRFDGLGFDLWTAGVGDGREPTIHAEHLRSGPGEGNRFAGRAKNPRADYGKHIPVSYLRASYSQRLALLQGIMDTDGSVSRNGQCELSLSDERLALDALDLIHTLGIKARIATEPSSYRDEEGELMVCKDRHRIHFTTAQGVFRLNRKAARLPETTRTSNDWLYIESIEQAETRPGKCIQVSNEDSTYLCGPNYVPTHNTALIEAAVTHAERQLMTLLCTPDHTKDSLLLRFVGEGHGDELPNGERSPFTLGPLAYAAKHGQVFYADEFMLLEDGVKPIFYSLADGRRYLPEGNVDGSPLEIHEDFRLVVSSNPLVRGASLPEPMASRAASTTLTIETNGAMLRDLGIDESIVAAWEALGAQGLWRPQIREMRLADYWMPIDVDQAVSAFLPEHCPESERKNVRDCVVSFLGGGVRNDGRLVVS